MLRIVIVLLCMAIAACADHNAPTQAAPIGDKAVLEHLAAEYNKLAENLPTSPWHMPPSDRKDFVVKVFAASGYSYSATLHQLAEGGWSPDDKNTKDLIDLLFMPHTDVRAVDGIRGVYSEEELADVRKVQKMLP
jgi:hypothetical protein